MIPGPHQHGSAPFVARPAPAPAGVLSRVSAVNEGFQRGHAFVHQPWWWGHKARIARPGAFDLGGEQGLAPHIGVEKQLGVGEQGGDPLKPSAGQQRPLVQCLQRPRQLQRRIRRQWRCW